MIYSLCERQLRRRKLLRNVCENRRSPQSDGFEMIDEKESTRKHTSPQIESFYTALHHVPNARNRERYVNECPPREQLPCFTVRIACPLLT